MFYILLKSNTHKNITHHFIITASVPLDIVTGNLKMKNHVWLIYQKFRIRVSKKFSYKKVTIRMIWSLEFGIISLKATKANPQFKIASLRRVHHTQWIMENMMTSSNVNIFRITGLLCGEFTGHRWIPLIKASDAELWCFLWSAPE